MTNNKNQDRNRSMRKTTRLVISAWLVGACTTCFSQSSPALQNYFRKHVGLNDDEIKSIGAGTSVAKALPSRTPAEIFVFGAVYVNAAPESYVQLSRDFKRLREIPGFLAVGVFSSPPRLTDLSGFSFEPDDIEGLRDCKPADCEVQLPDAYIEDLRKSVDWSNSSHTEQINKKLQQGVVDRLAMYQRDGNRVLGVYHDKTEPIDVSKQFKYMLSYSKALPEHAPAFYRYLLDYPKGKPPSTEDAFYWAKVKFGLKPTLRVIHVITTKGGTPGKATYLIAEKQLYASHYFQTALDLTFCVSDGVNSQKKGFYLIKVLGSEQAGLTGFTGSMLRRVAVGKSVSSLQESLTTIKNVLENRK